MGYAIAYQNLELSVSPQVNGLVFKQPVSLYVWLSQSVTSGIVSSTFSEPINFLCSVQQENQQNLMNIQGFDASKIYYRFYFQSNTISGVNRPIGHAQDYLIWNTQRYTIVQVFDTFNTGWKYIVGVQDTGD